MRRRSGRNQAGFTLIELLIVIAIIGILAAILIPYFVRARAQSARSACLENIHNIGTALELYFTENDAYPDAGTWEADLVSGGYIRAVPREPVNGNSYNYATDVARSTFPPGPRGTSSTGRRAGCRSARPWSRPPDPVERRLGRSGGGHCANAVV